MRIFKSEVKEMKNDPKPEAEKPATPIASERVDTQQPRPDVAGQAAPASEPIDKRPA